MEGTIKTATTESAIEEFLTTHAQECDSLDGCALDLIQSIPRVSGEDYTDAQCLEVILKIATKWKEIGAK
jgi:hypothetical protein